MADDIDADDIGRLTKIMRSISSNFEGVRDAAASRFNATLEGLGLNPADLAVIIVNSDEVRADEFQSQIEDARKRRRIIERDNSNLRASNTAMLDFIEKHHGKEQRRRFERAPILKEWPEFEELVRTRVFGGKLPRHWQLQVAPRFNATVARMNRWMSGTAAIPPEVMDILDDLPTPDTDLEIIVATARLDRQRNASKLNDDQTMRVAQRLFAGESIPRIADELGFTTHQVRGIEWIRPPLWRITVQEDGDLDWFQLWEMESVISGARKWKESALIRLELPVNFAYTDDLNKASPEIVQAMRDSYFAKEPYRAFARTALQWHEASTNKSAKLSSLPVLYAARREAGFNIRDTAAFDFAARFNEEFFDLFEMQKGVQKRHSAVKEDC